MSEPDDTDMLAAEYVLGTSDAAERANVAARLGRDPELARAVEAWGDRLAPLLDAVPDVSPPSGAYAEIVARLFGTSATSGGSVVQLRRRLRRWQGAAAGLAVLAASLVAWIAVRDGAGAPDQRAFTAVLQRDAGAPAMVVEVDLAARRLTVRPFGAAAPADHSYELWIIDPTLGAPRSLGLVAAGAQAQESLGSFDPGTIANATYAVTVEPAGGSPTGLPTTSPVLTGKLSRFRS